MAARPLARQPRRPTPALRPRRRSGLCGGTAAAREQDSVVDAAAAAAAAVKCRGLRLCMSPSGACVRGKGGLWPFRPAGKTQPMHINLKLLPCRVSMVANVGPRVDVDSGTLRTDKKCTTQTQHHYATVRGGGGGLPPHHRRYYCYYYYYYYAQPKGSIGAPGAHRADRGPLDMYIFTI